MVVFFNGFDGIPDTSKKVSSWELVSRIYQGDGGQWCIIGDLNEIITQDEKIGGRPRPQKQMEQFRSVLESNGLIDMEWKNQKFTWSNRHHNETFAKERLDRMVANQKWLNEFGLSRVEVLASSRSDHLPIMFSIGEQIDWDATRKWVFRFKAKWALKEDGEQTIRNAWQKQGLATDY